MASLFGSRIRSSSDGPTNDVWIDPWCKHLNDRLGVTLVPNATVRFVQPGRRPLRSVSGRAHGQLEEVAADFHVAAMPVEIMQGLVTQTLMRAARRLRARRIRTEWMNRHPVYLETDEPLTDGCDLSRLELGAHVDLAAAVLARLRLIAVWR